MAPEPLPEQPKVAPEILAAALAATEGRVTRKETPFPGSTLYVPSDGEAHAGIVLLHGSEGGGAGFTDLQAIRWADQGFAVLAYNYFGGPGAPEKLARVDLWQTREALKWLRQSEHVQERKVGLWGGSRGAEQALLLASMLRTDANLSAVAAHAPHATVVGSFDPSSFRQVQAPDGRPVPAWRIGETNVVEGRSIDIELFPGPVFLTHGTEDELWDVGQTRRLEARLERAGHSDFEVDYLEGEGHNPRPEARARSEQRTLGFFRRALGEP